MPSNPDRILGGGQLVDFLFGGFRFHFILFERTRVLTNHVKLIPLAVGYSEASSQHVYKLDQRPTGGGKNE